MRSLKLTNLRIESLDFLREMRQLKLLTIDGCGALSDISALSTLSSLEYVSLKNATYQVDEKLLSDIAKRVGFQLDFDLYDDPLGYETG
jgi:hypothetical protein